MVWCGVVWGSVAWLPAAVVAALVWRHHHRQPCARLMCVCSVCPRECMCEQCMCEQCPVWKVVGVCVVTGGMRLAGSWVRSGWWCSVCWELKEATGAEEYVWRVVVAVQRPYVYPEPVCVSLCV